MLKSASYKEENEAAILEEDKVWAFFLSLRGKLVERMEKEKAEALAVKLKYQEAQKELAELDGTIAALVAEQAGLEGCLPEYERLYEEKRQRLIREGNDASARILVLSEEAARAKSRLAAICAALEAGEEVIAALDALNGQLKEAEEADGDGMGLVGLMDRRGCLNKASERAEKTRQLFDIFKAKAASVAEMQDKKVSTGYLVADILFEDFAAKGGYYDRLERSESNAAVIRSEMLCSLIKLRQLKSGAQERVNELTAKLDALVLGTAE